MARTPKAAAPSPSRSEMQTAGAANIDTKDVTHYRIRVGEFFFAHEVLFKPGGVFMVSKKVYESTLADNRNFKDLCTEVTPVLPKESLP